LRWVLLRVDVTKATTDPVVREAIAGIHSAASAAGLVAAIHAGNSKAGHAMSQLGFQMITLESESQALTRGAAAGLREARGDQ
jgi:4-hydroxy-2-oxoheptanedioate aldolase